MLPLEADDPRVIGEFRLQARLGAGGMGRVYLASSPGGRAVAVKVIHPHLASDPAFGDRFRREVAAALAVNGAYAAPVIAAGADDDPPWLATAFVPGPSLQEVVTGGGALPEDAVLKLAAGLAEALRAIHDSGLVHRDLKPGNVLLAEDGPRVIDFGIARTMDGTVLTSAGSVLGTPSYMSPEQAQAKLTGPASDVFALGGVVYFAATGDGPFGTGHPAVMLYRIVHTEPDLTPVPPRLRDLVAACLAKDPERRPTPADLAAGLMAAAPPGEAPAAFWPAPVAQIVRDFQARLESGRPAGTLPTLAGGPAGPTLADPAPQDSRPWPAVRDSRDARPATPQQGPGIQQGPGTQQGPGMGRRRALAALAGMAVGGVAVGGWELARSGASAATRGGGAPARHLPAPGRRVWSFDAGAAAVALVAGGGVLYAGTGNHTAFALDAATGKKLWRRVTSTGQNNQIAVAGRTVVLTDGDNGGMLGLDAGTGAQLWSVKTPGGVLGLAAAGDVVYAGIAIKSDTTGGVTALAAATGDVLWTVQFGQAVDTNGGLAVAGGVVYATTSDGEIYAYRAAGGGTLWRYAKRNVTFGAVSPVVAGGVLYVSSDFSSSDNAKPVLFAVGTSAGRGRWQHPLGTSSFAANVDAAAGLVFAGMTRQANSAAADAGDLSAVRAADGKQLWQVPVPGGVFPVAAGTGNVVYSGSNNGVLDAWQADTGRHLWGYSATEAVTSAIVLADGVAYFGSNDNHVYAVAAAR